MTGIRPLLALGLALLAAAPVRAADDAQALRDKSRGDVFAERDETERAADAYVQALSRGRFSAPERLRMATVISWGGRYPQAVRELRALLSENPEFLKARIVLAKTLAWMGDAANSLVEIEKVLKLAPGDREALLVEANALRLTGALKDAIALYNKILAGGDDFDARTGLAYALLAEGDRKAAAACAESLKEQTSRSSDGFDSRTGPAYAMLSRDERETARSCASALRAQYPYQEQARKDLAAELSADIKPAIDAERARPAEEPADEAAAVDIDALKKKLSSATDKEGRAALEKRIGDAYVAKEDFARAAGYYVDALAAGKFSVEDRMALATRISWGDRLADAAKEFRALSAEDPANVKAGVALARTLSWMGDNPGALAAIDKTLRVAPEDRDALLVKANALRLTGRLKESIAIYRALLEGGDEFGVRIGLAYALLAQGDDKGAAAAAPAKTQFPYQVKELSDLNAELAAATRPTYSAGFSYYNDTETNNVERYSLGYGRRLRGVRLDWDLTDVEAKDSTPRTAAADILSVEAYKKLGERFGAGGGLALDAARNAGANSSFLTWNVKADDRWARGAAAVSAVSYLMTDTAQLISNDVRATSYGLTAGHSPVDRVFLNAAYSYKDYSDNNGSNDAQLSPSYLLVRDAPRTVVGYRLRYLGFRRQSGSGYYDPGSNIAQIIFTNVSFDKGVLYGYVEPYGGHQTQHRYDAITNSYFAGGSGTLGWKPARGFSVEASAEGGNYAVQSASGFEYYQLGLRVVYIP